MPAAYESNAMAPTVIILGDGPSKEIGAHLGGQGAILYGRMLSDTITVASRLAGVRVLVRHAQDFDPALIVERAPGVTCVPALVAGAAGAQAALSTALAEGGPVVLIGGDLPHLPPTRLRDAFTMLEAGAAAVLGPSDHGSWYLLGLRAARPDILAAVPGYGEQADRFIAQLGRGAVHLLPPWFGVRTLHDLVTLCDELRSMPPQFATHTRALLVAGGASRMVGG